MKVKLEDNYKALYTIDELNQAKRVIAFEKNNDDMPLNEWAEQAAREATNGSYIVRVLEAEAVTSKNHRAWDYYGANTGRMDVWIRAIAETHNSIVKIGAYLSDIWQTGAVPYKHEMFVKTYKEA